MLFFSKITLGDTKLLSTKSAQKFCAEEIFPKAWVMEKFFVL